MDFSRKSYYCYSMKMGKIIFTLYIAILIQTIYATATEPHDLFIFPELVFKNKEHYTLIDIRNEKYYKLAHIPNSINLPVGKIAAKKYLRSKKIVLINRGYSSSSILKWCKKLKKQKFSVLILKGGINSWAIKNLPLSCRNIFNIFEITPVELYKSLKSALWLAVNISETPVKNKYLKRLETLNIPKLDTSLQKRALLNSISDKIENRKLLIYGKDGKEYLLVHKILESSLSAPSNTSVSNIFFLKGGSNQFNLFTKRVLRFPIARKILSSEDDCDCD
jgi:rhodanese-related sulfurtransferase